MNNIEQYRKWLAQTANQLHYDSNSSYDDMYIAGFEKALNKFKELFPVAVQKAHIVEPVYTGIIDRMWPLQDDQQDDTDKLYPR